MQNAATFPFNLGLTPKTIETSPKHRVEPTLFAPSKEQIEQLNLLTQQIQSITKQQTPQEPVSQSGANGEYTVVYNPASLDSVFAAAQLVDALGLGVKDCIQHTFLDNPALLAGKNHLLVCGTELSRETLDAIRDGGNGMVTLFAYRNSYRWLGDFFATDAKGVAAHWPSAAQRYRKSWAGRLALVNQRDEDHGENYSLPDFFAVVDNTAIALTHTWLLEQGLTVKSASLDAARVAAMCQSTLMFPLKGQAAALVHESENPKECFEKELRLKVVLYHLHSNLRCALASATPLLKLQELQPHTDDAAYMDHWRKVGQTIQRGCTERSYRSGRGVVIMPTLACTELVHHDVLDYLGAKQSSMITYEDAHGLRIWRVCAKDQSLAWSLVLCLGGKEVWSEGTYLCTYTKTE